MNRYREKKIYCGDKYLEIDIYQVNILKTNTKSRSKKKRESLPAQKNLNDKNARRKFIQLVETNFTEEDYHLTLTYNDKNLPSTLELAEKEVSNMLKRIARKRKSKNLPKLKYILVTAHNEKKNGKIVRIHHHLIINGDGLTRDEIEELWSRPKRKGENKRERIGYANADKLQADSNSGFIALSTYLIKNPTSKKRWSCSQNLKRPISRTNDYRYSRRQINNIASKQFDPKWWESKYPGYFITDKDSGYETIYNDITGWSIYLRLRKRE
ncbi:MAG: hypothetical protein Q4A42_02920 [Tissierellia bacterium]|nr:hypothetical protein [Tissierellia bacterium]